MPNYITRKKTLMGKRYEIEVPLLQYGGDIIRVHAVPDLELARIEARAGYSLEDAMNAMSSQGLTEEEIASIQAGTLLPEIARKVSEIFTEEELDTIRSDQATPDLAGKLAQNFTEEEIKLIKVKPATPELIAKASRSISPKLTLFLGELCKAGIVPDPGCACKGKGCDDCDVKQMVEEFRGFTVQEVGMAVMGASTATWKDIEDFFSTQREQSGAGSSA